MATYNRRKSEKLAKGQVRSAWNWLRYLPEYRKDWEVFGHRTIHSAQQKQLLHKWGFYPLTDPDDEHDIPKKFMEDCWRLHQLSPFVDDMVKLKTSYLDDGKLVFEVDRHLSPDVAAEIIKGYLVTARVAKGLPKMPSRGERKLFDWNYKISLLLRLGHKKSEIQKMLITAKKDSQLFESQQIALKRAIKKARAAQK